MRRFLCSIPPDKYSQMRQQWRQSWAHGSLWIDTVGQIKQAKKCKVLIFLHPHTHHQISSISRLWCPIPGWQQWWQGQLLTPSWFILVHWRLTWINLRSVQFIQSGIRVEAHFWLWNKCPIHLLRSTVDKGRIKKCHKKLTLIFVLGWLNDISLAKTVQVLVHIQNHLTFLSHKSQFGWCCKHWCNFFN